MLTTEVKSALKTTIQELRAQLIEDLSNQLERTYQLGVAAEKVKLKGGDKERRERLEAWIDERVRATGAKKKDELKKASERFRLAAVKEAAYTLLNRIVVLRILEEDGHLRPPVISGGWASKGYQEFIAFAPALAKVSEDETEGYGLLLRLVMDEWALDLPGLFEDTGVSRLVPVPASTLREVVQRIDVEALGPAWSDDTTLGWVYQYWNDPDREALDAKLNARKKLESHEIASKTQMFTERYIVEWLLQNSLGLMWLAICQKNGWTPDAGRVFGELERQRREWRERRCSDEVPADHPVSVSAGLHDRWKYFVEQPVPDGLVESAPTSIRDVKLLDPACGSGHFLVIAFGLLAELYREEARHRGAVASDEEIAQQVLERNLFGVDIDPRAVQIAAAALVLTAKRCSPEVRATVVNLVAPTFDISGLSDEDPARKVLLERLQAEAGINPSVSTRLIDGLSGVSHLGTLLRVGKTVTHAVMTGTDPDRADVVERALEDFLAAHTGEADLGLHLDGEQLAAGVRFLRMIREGAFDLVVGNPPYQGTEKMADAGYVASEYPDARADLFAAFLVRSFELLRAGGMSALLTKRAWMFLKDFTDLRLTLLSRYDLRLLGDIDRGGFEDVLDEALSTSMSIFVKGRGDGTPTIALQPTPVDDRSRDTGRTPRKRAALLAQVGRFEFQTASFSAVDRSPMVYWWSQEEFDDFKRLPSMESVAPMREGVGTRNDRRYLRHWWEVGPGDVFVARIESGSEWSNQSRWVPFVKGAAGRAWFEPLSTVVRWENNGIQIGTYAKSRYGRGASFYFRPGVAFTDTGDVFQARAHRYLGVFGDKGTSVFPEDVAGVLCLLNSSRARHVLQSLAPGIDFQLEDVKRLPVLGIANAAEIFERLEAAFDEHESHRETSIEFVGPGPSCWMYAQDWAQRAVDRADDEPLPPWEPRYDDPNATAYVSFELGVALGRLDGSGGGVVTGTPPTTALPAGIMFISALGGRDSLEHPACTRLRAAWATHGSSVSPRHDLGTWLRREFFSWHRHRDQYDSRPIYIPISSRQKNFVALVSIHRWRDDTLAVLLADHLVPERSRLQARLDDVVATIAKGNPSQEVERQLAELQSLAAELDDLVHLVQEVADRGPPRPDAETTDREEDAAFAMDLDDGVMVNAAGLWPLIEPQWDKPKSWWKQLADPKGKKDYDWSHLARRYFPKRVRTKCGADPSVAVAHGCLWQEHASVAYAWELRLGYELGVDVVLTEEGAADARAAYLAEHPDEAADVRRKEERRARRAQPAGEGQQELGLGGRGAEARE